MSAPSSSPRSPVPPSVHRIRRGIADRPMPADSLLANYYRAALLAKYTLAGLPLGWIFWRWGLPYSILCHVAANAAHLVLQHGIFGT
jgi:hypothetical protein